MRESTSSFIQRRNSVLLGYCDERDQNLGFRGPEPFPVGGREVSYAGDGHLVCVAPTGRGKGVSVVIPTLLTYPGPVVVFDPKGENYAVTARRRRELGQRVVRLDPFGVASNGTDALNVFDVFDLPNADVVSDAEMLTSHLATNLQGTKEPFWDQSGGGLVAGVMAHVAHGSPLEQRHLGTVCEILSTEDVAYNLAVLLDTVGKSMHPFAAREIAAFLQMPDVTRGGVLATAQSYLKTYSSERVQRAFRKSSTILLDLMNGEPLTLYIVIPPDKLASHRALYKIWVATLLKAVLNRTRIPQLRTLFLLDECAQLGNFPYLETLITLCRGYGVQVHTFWQDLSQLRQNYPQSWETILNNAGVIQCFGVGNYLMAAQWAAILNRSPTELIQLGADEQIVFVEGRGDVRSRKLNYLLDHRFAGLFDPNPYYERDPGLRRRYPRDLPPR